MSTFSTFNHHLMDKPPLMCYHKATPVKHEKELLL